MTRVGFASVGIIGRVCAILLLTIGAVVVSNTALYEHSSRLTIREDEARRAAEHIIVVARILEVQAPAQRVQIASSASTEHFELKWFPWGLVPAPDAVPLHEMRTQMMRWEPALHGADLRLQTSTAPGSAGQVVGALRLADSSWLHFTTPDLVSDWSVTLRGVLPALLPVLALSLVGLLLLREVLTPLRLLVDAATNVGRGSPTVLPEQGPTEFRRLIRAYNDMQSRICTMISEKVEALAAVGHDLRTPLARLRLSLDAVSDQEVRTAMDRDLLEMEQMLTSLLTYYGGDEHPEPPLPVDIAVMAATIVDELQDRGHSAAYHGPGHCDVMVRWLPIKRALGNLADNARLYGTHTDITVSVTACSVAIYVDDNGPGVPAESLTRILEPFHRLDSARRRNTAGVGLGLTIAARAIADAGGKLVLSNRATGGLRAAFELPLLIHSPETLRHTSAAT